MQKAIAVLLLFAAQALVSIQAQAQNGRWAVDKSHSNVKFTVTHMTVSEVDGSFKVFDGSMEHTKADFSDAKVTFTIDVNSINTDNQNRDDHLRGDDFFSVAQYPQIKFVGTSMKPVGGNKYQLTGNMTVRDVTKPVTWEVTYGGVVNTQRGKKAGFKAKTTINRFDYNLKWNRAVEAGGLVVGENVDIVVNIELNEVKS
jgi:polyisoprenoid-binding protein YceI